MSYTMIAMTEAVQQRFADVRVLARRAALATRAGVPPTWEEDWRRLHAIWRGVAKADIAADPLIAAYVDFYLRLGLKPKQTPPSVQNIIQRFLIGDTLARWPTINPIVDAVNVAAVETLIPLGVFDAQRVDGHLELALTVGGELFDPLGSDAPVTLPADVLVLRDRSHVLSQFGYRDSKKQQIRAATQEIWLLGCQVPGVAAAQVERAIDRAMDLLQRAYFVAG